MAQYQHLPIYKSTYELLQAVTRATTGFPRDFKYSLGDKLRGEVVELVVFIFKANSSRARQPVGDIRAVANSYFGILGQANAWRERSRMAAMLRGHGHIVALQANRMFTERIPL